MTRVLDHIRGLWSVALVMATVAVAAGAASAQEAPVTLSLDEAIALARQYNPDYRSQENDLVSARWGVRSAYGSLLPSASASMGMGYTEGGERRFGTVGLGEQPAMYSSSYSLNLSYSLSGAELLEPSRARAQERATEARVQGAGSQLEANVSQAYLSALQADAALEQARLEVERTAQHVRLAEARLEVGLGTTLDVRRAEVQHGQAEIRVVQAENTAAAERLALGRLIGVPLEDDVELVSQFDLFEPVWDREEIIERALETNPVLRAARAQMGATGTSLQVARTAYLPSLNASVGWRGDLAQAASIDPLLQNELSSMARVRQSCLDQNAMREAAGLPPLDCPDPTDPAVVSSIEQELRARHSGFPFDWRPQPLSASLSISLPVFNGFAREQRLGEARVALDDARYMVRAEELRVRAEAETLLRNVTAAYRTAQLQARVRETAAEELRLAEEQYSSGVATSVEVMDAQANLSEAERAEIAALYDYHQSLAALEALLGTSLR